MPVTLPVGVNTVPAASVVAPLLIIPAALAVPVATAGNVLDVIGLETIFVAPVPVRP